MTLDDVLPDSHFGERHERRIAAPPAAVWQALEELRLGDSRIGSLLMAIRMLPARLARRELPKMVTGRFLEQGPLPVLDRAPDDHVVAAGVMQPWKITGRERPPRLDAAGVRAFTEPGWVKCAIDFVLIPDGAGTWLTTETRIQATDARTRARFGLYWAVIRLGSDLIRRDMLRVIANRAEAAPAVPERAALA